MPKGNSFFIANFFLDIGNDREIEKYCPPLLPGVDYDDHLTEDDSDGDEYPNIPVILLYIVEPFNYFIILLVLLLLYILYRLNQ